MTPRGIHATSGIDGDCCFATKADVLCDSCFDHATVGGERTVIQLLRRLSFVRRACVRHRGDFVVRFATVEPKRVHDAVGAKGKRLPSARARQ
jgi:hypothetical protein